jgi:hypothetical protein
MRILELNLMDIEDKDMEEIEREHTEEKLNPIESINNFSSSNRQNDVEIATAQRQASPVASLNSKISQVEKKEPNSANKQQVFVLLSIAFYILLGCLE